MTEQYPFGPTALHPDWPDAKFNVSGLFVYDNPVLNLVRLMRLLLDCQAPIESVHGAPAVRWNSGRVSSVSVGPDQARATFNAYASMGIGCFLTFTNHVLEQADLDDRICNGLLDMAAAAPQPNGVIVASDRLSRYIAQRHPDLRQVASIVKVAIENGRGKVDYYRSMGDRFWRYMVHPDDCRDLKLLDQLDREKAEIIVNEHCVRNCELRPRHYEAMARYQMTTDPATLKPGGLPPKAQQCMAPQPKIALLKELPTDCSIARPLLKAIYDMGFRHFKIQGRGLLLPFYLSELARYTMENDYVAPMMFSSLFHSFIGRPPEPTAKPAAASR